MPWKDTSTESYSPYRADDFTSMPRGMCSALLPPSVLPDSFDKAKPRCSQRSLAADTTRHLADKILTSPRLDAAVQKTAQSGDRPMNAPALSVGHRKDRGW